MTKITYSFTMSDKQIQLGSADVSVRSIDLRKHCHMLACSILNRWAKTGDAGAAANAASTLLVSVDKSHAQKLVNWFGKYGAFALDESNKEVLRYSSDKTTISVAEYQAAKAETMFELTADPTLKALDLGKRLDALLKEVDKHTTKPVDGDVIPAAVVQALREARQAIAA